MSPFTASQLRSLPASASAPRGPHAAQTALLKELARDSGQPILSRVVFVGIVRAIEFLVLSSVGIALYYAYVEREAASNALYYPVTFSVSVVAVLLFQTLQGYSVPTFRFPVRRLSRLAGGLGASFLLIFALVFFLKPTLALSRFWIVSWFFFGFLAIGIERLFLARLVSVLARNGRLERRAVVVGGGEFAVQLFKRPRGRGPGRSTPCSACSTIAATTARPRRSRAIPSSATSTISSSSRASRASIWRFSRCRSPPKQRILQMLRKLWVLPIDIRLAAHANRLRFRPRSYSYVGSGADARRLRQADRRLGRRHQARLRQDRWRARVDRAVADLLRDRDRHQARFSRTGAVQAEALRLQQRADRDLQVPLDVYRQARSRPPPSW